MKIIIIIFLFSFVNNCAASDLEELNKSIKDLERTTNEYLRINKLIISEISKTGTLSSSKARILIKELEEIKPIIFKKYKPSSKFNNLDSRNKNNIKEEEIKLNLNKNTTGVNFDSIGVVTSLNNGGYTKHKRIAIIIEAKEFGLKRSQINHNIWLMARILRNRRFNVILIPPFKANRETILESIFQARKDLINGGEFIYYHYGQIATVGHENYFLMKDTDVNAIDAFSLSFEDIKSELDMIEAKNKKIYIDIKPEGVNPIINFDKKLVRKGLVDLNSSCIHSINIGHRTIELSRYQYTYFTIILAHAITGAMYDGQRVNYNNMGRIFLRMKNQFKENRLDRVNRFIEEFYKRNRYRLNSNDPRIGSELIRKYMN